MGLSIKSVQLFGLYFISSKCVLMRHNKLCIWEKNKQVIRLKKLMNPD